MSAQRAWRGDGAPRQDAVNTLDCPDCGSWFPTFDALARHVTARHNPLMLGADAPKKATTPMKMKPSTRTTASPRERTGRIPSADRSGGASDFNPFLKAEHIGRGRLGDTAIIVLTGAARVTESQFGEQILAEGKVNGTLYDWAIKLNSPNHRYIEDTLGLESEKWRGKKVPLVVKENLGRLYVAVERPAAKRS